ncbi:serine/threonine-protein kinase [Diaminobutyricimonas aerilata]|uniref:serine/threonine-protein kinase n=1 Tax=Diaminobutyricimonas aerilata TaxID=1162967 RepID=UPI0012FDB936|nr:serine/threonine-protein kinase [Diaminobutyricimonas aerilata]
MPHRVNHLLGGRYRIHTPLGSGGMGSVYQATDESLGREVAVKVFRREAATAEEVLRQEHEIRLLASLNHPGLVSVFDAGTHMFDDEVRRYLVMELIEDSTLESRLVGEPLELHEVADLGSQIAEALAYVHAHQIVHRDVKPANILIAEGGQGLRRVAKLTDFGIAQFAGGNRITSAGTVIGTASYLSPEQTSTGQVSGASDVYSLGLVLLEALTGVKSFPGTAIESVAARLVSDPDIPADLPAEWRVLIGRMTARNPEDRPSAASVAKSLRGTAELDLSAVSLDATQPHPIVPEADARPAGRADDEAPRRPRRGARRSLDVRMLAGVGLLALLGAVIGASWISGTVGGGADASTVVQYPAVSGDLATPLQRLQDAVELR